MDFNTYKNIDAINSSLIKAFIDHPLNARDYLAQEQPDTEAFQFGRLVHAAAFEWRKLRGMVHIKPETYTNEKGEEKPWNANSNVCKEWLRTHNDRPVLSAAQVEEIRDHARAVKAHPHGASLFKSAVGFEDSLVVFDPEFKVNLKARLDHRMPNAIADLKTMQSAKTEDFAASIWKYQYHMQAAFYKHVAQLAGYNVEDFYFIAVEKGTKRVNVRKLDPMALKAGDELWRDNLPKLLQCMATQDWPDYSGSGEIQTIDLPEWAWKQYQFEADKKLEGWEEAA